MKDFKIKTKLMLSFVVIMIISTGIGLFGILSLRTIRISQEKMLVYNTFALRDIGNIRANLQNQRVLLRDILLLDHENEQAILSAQQLGELEESMEAHVDSYLETITLADDEKAFRNFRNLYENDFYQLKQEILNNSDTHEEHVTKMLASSRELTDQIYEYLDQSLELNANQAVTSVADNRNLVSGFVIVEIIIILGGIAAAVVLALYLNRRIAAPISSLLPVVGKMSDGDMEGVNVAAESEDEIGQFIRSFQRMAENIRQQAAALNIMADGDLSREFIPYSENDTIGQSLKKCSDNLNRILWEINVSANQVSTGAEQVSESSQLLAQGASEQATAIEQLSSSIFEISLNTKESARMTESLASLYQGMKERAREGTDLMNEMIRAIEGIQSATRDISKIMKLMGDISFQTNILSINAAVEAANAGEQGRGFAVVADEVRNLAKKSSQAAADTEELIETCIEKVSQGSRITGQTHEALLAIMGDIVQSSQHIDDIATASNEQSISIEQINTGIDQVSKVINMNSSGADQSAMAAEEMSAMAEHMAELVANFKLRQSTDQETVYRTVKTAKKEKPVILFQEEKDNKY